MRCGAVEDCAGAARGSAAGGGDVGAVGAAVVACCGVGVVAERKSADTIS